MVARPPWDPDGCVTVRSRRHRPACAAWSVPLACMECTGSKSGSRAFGTPEQGFSRSRRPFVTRPSTGCRHARWRPARCRAQAASARAPEVRLFGHHRPAMRANRDQLPRLPRQHVGGGSRTVPPRVAFRMHDMAPTTRPPQVALAHLGYRPRLAARCVLARHKAEPGREVAPAAEPVERRREGWIAIAVTDARPPGSSSEAARLVLPADWAASSLSSPAIFAGTAIRSSHRAEIAQAGRSPRPQAHAPARGHAPDPAAQPPRTPQDGRAARDRLGALADQNAHPEQACRAPADPPTPQRTASSAATPVADGLRIRRVVLLALDDIDRRNQPNLGPSADLPAPVMRARLHRDNAARRARQKTKQPAPAQRLAERHRPVGPRAVQLKARDPDHANLQHGPGPRIPYRPAAQTTPHKQAIDRREGASRPHIPRQSHRCRTIGGVHTDQGPG